jgi:hypothetical protein
MRKSSCKSTVSETVMSRGGSEPPTQEFSVRSLELVFQYPRMANFSISFCPHQGVASRMENQSSGRYNLLIGTCARVAGSFAGGRKTDRPSGFASRRAHDRRAGLSSPRIQNVTRDRKSSRRRECAAPLRPQQRWTPSIRLLGGRERRAPPTRKAAVSRGLPGITRLVPNTRNQGSGIRGQGSGRGRPGGGI